MSLLQRWSLPSRGFVRDKSKDEEEPTEQAKYPTMHLSQMGPRRRANLSSVFSTLFEKPENRHDVVRRGNDGSQVADDSPLLVSRHENIRPDADSRHEREHECENPITTTIGTAPLLQGGLFTSLSKGPTADICSGTSPDIVVQSTPQTSEKRRPRCFSLSSNTTTHETVDVDELEPPFMTTAEKAKIRDRCLSASSSYPSEGMRSPMSGCCSPEPPAAASHTMKYFSEYRRFGQYPSKSSWHLASMSTDDAPVSGEHERDITVSSATETVTPTICTMAVQNYDYQAPAFSNLPEGHTDPMCVDTMGSERISSPPLAARVGVAHQKPSSTSEVTVPILENEDAISSRLEVSFLSYKRPQAESSSSTTSASTVSSSNKNNHNQGRNRAHTPHPTEATERTMLTAIKRERITDAGADDDDDGAWSTIHERRLSRPSSWLQLFSLTTTTTTPAISNDTTTTTTTSNTLTLAQRLHKFKIRKWAKRACFKTKARFELVGKPVPVPVPVPVSVSASSGSKFKEAFPRVSRAGIVGGRPRKWRLGMRMKKVRKSLGKTEKKEKVKTKEEDKKRQEGEEGRE